MKCEEALRRIAGLPDSADDDLADHLETCVECSLVGADALGQLAIATEPQLTDDDVVQAIRLGLQESLARERGWVGWLRSRSTAQRVAIAVLPSIVVPIAFGIAQRRIDLSVYPPGRLMGIAVLLVALIALALWGRLRPASRAPASYGSVVAVTAIAWVAVAADATAPVAHASLPASLEGAGADLLPRALGCFLAGTSIALPALLLVGLVDRWSDNRKLSLLLLPLLAGLSGYLALHLHCHLVAPVHLVAGHLTVVVAVLLTGICAFAARRNPASQKA